MLLFFSTVGQQFLPAGFAMFEHGPGGRTSAAPGLVLPAGAHPARAVVGWVRVGAESLGLLCHPSQCALALRIS